MKAHVEEGEGSVRFRKVKKKKGLAGFVDTKCGVCVHRIFGRRMALSEQFAAMAMASQDAPAPPTAAWRTLPTRVEREPPRRRAEIIAACRQTDIDFMRARSLRDCVLLSAHPYKVNNDRDRDSAAILAAATQLEDAVGDFLRLHGVTFTQAQQLSMHASATGGPTPDFLIDSVLFVNGRRVRWIEVKRFYGTGVAGLKNWSYNVKVFTQVRARARAQLMLRQMGMGGRRGRRARRPQHSVRSLSPPLFR